MRRIRKDALNICDICVSVSVCLWDHVCVSVCVYTHMHVNVKCKLKQIFHQAGKAWHKRIPIKTPTTYLEPSKKEAYLKTLEDAIVGKWTSITDPY